LHPEDILPNSLFTPRTPIVDVESSEDVVAFDINANTKFVKNPLAMLIEVPLKKGTSDGNNSFLSC
jgi:hypothetical protein